MEIVVWVTVVTVALNAVIAGLLLGKYWKELRARSSKDDVDRGMVPVATVRGHGRMTVTALR